MLRSLAQELKLLRSLLEWQGLLKVCLWYLGVLHGGGTKRMTLTTANIEATDKRSAAELT